MVVFFLVRKVKMLKRHHRLHDLRDYIDLTLANFTVNSLAMPEVVHKLG